MTATVQELPTVSGLTTEVMSVSPAMAEKWLGKNVRNRHVSQVRVGKYARSMRRGEWMLTGEAIKFAVNGDLIDGQHRLLAVIEAGKTIRLLVIRGLPSDAQDVLDTGAARTACDQLTIHGHANGAVLAAAAKLAILWETGRFYVNQNEKAVSHREILNFAEGNHILALACGRATAISKGSDLKASVAGAAFYELMQVDGEAALEFFDRLADGVNLPASSPILALRNRLRALRDDKTRVDSQALMALVFRAWNAWRDKKRLTALPLYYKGDLIRCPEPH